MFRARVGALARTTLELNGRVLGLEKRSLSSVSSRIEATEELSSAQVPAPEPSKMRVTALAALIGAASAQVEHGGKPRASQPSSPRALRSSLPSLRAWPAALTSPVCTPQTTPTRTAPATPAPI